MTKTGASAGSDTRSAPTQNIMKIGIVTPAPPGSRYGNRVTAVRWGGILKGLGHRVKLVQHYDGRPFDLLIALHARRSHESIRLFHDTHPGRPLIVALTGTDLYRDLARVKSAQRSLEMASRLIVLQPKALDHLSPQLHGKTRVIYQSVDPSKPAVHLPRRTSRHFDVCVIGHLRQVKDPFRAAMAARLLPQASRIRVLQVGGAMNNRFDERARREMQINPRYRWIGEQPHYRVRQILMKSNL